MGLAEAIAVKYGDTPIDLFDLSSSSPPWCGSGNEFETSRVPSRSRPSRRPWAVLEGASRPCLMILVTTNASSCTSDRGMSASISMTFAMDAGIASCDGVAGVMFAVGAGNEAARAAAIVAAIVGVSSLAVARCDRRRAAMKKGEAVAQQTTTTDSSSFLARRQLELLDAPSSIAKMTPIIAASRTVNLRNFCLYIFRSRQFDHDRLALELYHKYLLSRA